MLKTVDKFLLAGVIFMPEFHLRQPGFTYITCGSFPKYCKLIQKFKERGSLRHIYKKDLDQTCSAYNAAYSDSKIS